ncbi:FkbM family methyltransferase [Nocardia sp. NPDC058633]|uniref:FkbM family methyltransferase n=1 Tax=Nocardia sp. NPDC058633 TaxID=3346568 RepID=UPI003651BD4B
MGRVRQRGGIVGDTHGRGPIDRAERMRPDSANSATRWSGAEPGTITLPGSGDQPRPSGPCSTRLSAAAGVLSWLSPRASCIETEAAQLAELVNPGAVCLDIGAGYGLYSTLFAAAAGPHGRTLAIDANPRLTNRLQRLATALRAPSLQPIWAAVSSTSGVDTQLSVPYRHRMPVCGRAFMLHGAAHHGPNSEFDRDRRINLTTTTLDELTEQHGVNQIDVIKVDIEGAEYAMLRGAHTVLARHRPVWMLEIEERHLAKYGHRAADVVDLMASHGYAMYRWHGDQWQRCSHVSPTARNYLFRIP